MKGVYDYLILNISYKHKMANIFDYLDWRDIKIENVEFNEIDNLILSRLSYFPLDGLIEKNKEVELIDVYKKLIKKPQSVRYLQDEDKDLFPKLAFSTRFGELKLTEFINNIDPDAEKQFSAITIILPNDMIYVAYRGTDNTVVGWKEDFNMSFSSSTAAQEEAVEYLEKIYEKYPNKQIYVGGHSKGGNLAVYASIFCKKEIQDKIIEVYNNDGPGFLKSIVETPEYNRVIKKVHTYIPQTSIVGRLLLHKEETTIVKSTQVGIMQHDLYSWQVLGGKFVRTELTNSSEFFAKKISNWLSEVAPEQREEFINVMYEILSATNAKTLSEINSNKVASAKAMVTTYKNLNPENKQLLIQTFKLLFNNSAE